MKKMKREFQKIISIIKKIHKSTYFLLSLSGFSLLFLVEYFRREMLPNLTLQQHAEMSKGIGFNNLEVLIGVLSLFLLTLTPIILSEKEKISKGLLLPISIIVSLIFSYIGFNQSIMEKRIVTLLIVSLYILIFSLFIVVREFINLLLNWMITDEKNDKLDIKKLTFVWGIIVVIFGWLISK
ncbi:hypothetical protein EA794_10465 [Lactococcus petauri]|uniref:hypothetical protein n=1 Tax=Lactococcus petauri TaxID=1940789 RepID=UPI0013FD869E|nr:hypothetical protein [Lactococcus petauri]NHI76375.1 hypothetical protein [Lactococcus petauri]